MKDCNYCHEFRTVEGVYGAHYYMETITVDEALRIFDASCEEMKTKGAKEIFKTSSLAIYLVKDGYHIFNWHYLGRGYATPETFRERVIVFLQRLEWGWSHWRCIIAQAVGLDWQVGHRWPHRKK